MISATAVGPPATDPNYRRSLEPAGAPCGARSASASASTTALDTTATAPAAAAAAAAHAGEGGVSSDSLRRLSVILHGKRADEADVRAAVAALRSEGVRVDVKVTWESGDVERFVKDIVKARSADTVVAAGGDGTLNEVVAALIKVKAPRDIAVGLMPMGTSNDFAAVTGVPQHIIKTVKVDKWHSSSSRYMHLPACLPARAPSTLHIQNEHILVSQIQIQIQIQIQMGPMREYIQSVCWKRAVHSTLA
ncbi:hypothetical protein VOLCADRAFT_98149 [Volvox carteri f. nagariensis]|uniref:DAGKc domain-containing protein n=1 Tax=Volvox carteri f. nagariensis TaxID=3068 RepID=D8UEK5_VOLCA|nr:uncharacterized protein VOLCADRAFT_98149 [Volvox carteri f. nagariensis]EFJ41900.1 hypothetical protein VOLCADRAFT_98149 [Volvox carteri f. nagariensis]|eukprot:XP_002957098.1 hypothetical protein VOLCADRAFT_98149 [Volvox carteri f. nagariensis]